MRSFGKAFLLVVATVISFPSEARAQQAAPPSTTVASPASVVPVVAPVVPATLAGQVTGLIARQWMVDSASLQLQWGYMRPTDSFPARTAVRLVGRGDGGWFSVTFVRDSVPLFAVRVRAGSIDSVMAAARALNAGTTLAAEDLQQTRLVRWGPPVKQDVQPGVGWVTRRALNIGDVITAAAVVPPQIIHKGDQIQLQWVRGSVVVALEAIALQAGGVGQVVRVQLVERGGERSGVVIAPGIVRMES